MDAKSIAHQQRQGCIKTLEQNNFKNITRLNAVLYQGAQSC